MEDFFGGEVGVLELIDQVIVLVMVYVFKVVFVIVILIVGLWLINCFVVVFDVKFGKKDLILNKFFCGLIGVVFKILLLIFVVFMVGIVIIFFVVIIGVVGFVIGFVFQGSFVNFVGGVLILIFKLFKVGDIIEVQGFFGVVDEISIFYIIVNIFDNCCIVIFNGSLFNVILVNVSIYENCCCDMMFGIGYGDDIDKVKFILKCLMEEDECSLIDLVLCICVVGLGDSFVDLMF